MENLMIVILYVFYTISLMILYLKIRSMNKLIKKSKEQYRDLLIENELLEVNFF